MATVKLQNGKVLLKGGKVSCSCCESEPGCCLFPADYGWEEVEESSSASFLPYFSKWPAQLRVNWPGHLEGNIDKSATPFEYQTGEIRIRRNDDESAWILEDLTDPENIVTRTIGRCLIRGDGGLTPGNNLIEDLWADQYITDPPVTSMWGSWVNEDGSFAPSITYTVTFTRVSLCEWVSTGHPPECDPWTLHALDLLTYGFTIVLNDYAPAEHPDVSEAFCDEHSEENWALDPDGAVYDRRTVTYSITLVPL